MTRTLTPREKRITDIASALRNAARQKDMDWPRAGLTDPMITGDRHTLLKSRVYDADCVKQGAQIIEAMLVDADGFATLYALAGKDIAAFKALVVLAQIELDRKPEAVAA